ncbi:MAG: hypothetical protein WEB00_12985 [Dehalococcoidia bacterium]
MKRKVSMTLEQAVLDEVAQRSPNGGSRSSAVELALRDWLFRLEREEINRRDRDIIDRHADELNAEAEDVLEYQADIFEE